MQLNEHLTSEVWVDLKSINYKSLEAAQKQTVTTKDSYEVLNKTANEITIMFHREVNLAISRGYNLKIDVEFKRYAKENVNFEEILSDEIIEENIIALCNPITNYVSLLVAQISANFNRQPIISAPIFIKAE